MLLSIIAVCFLSLPGSSSGPLRSPQQSAAKGSFSERRWLVASHTRFRFSTGPFRRRTNNIYGNVWLNEILSFGVWNSISNETKTTIIVSDDGVWVEKRGNQRNAVKNCKRPRSRVSVYYTYICVVVLGIVARSFFILFIVFFSARQEIERLVGRVKLKIKASRVICARL